MKKSNSKKEAQKEIEDFFNNIKNKSAREVKKIKKLAISYKIPLKEKRKLFCKKCFNSYKNPKIRIKNRIKSVSCENCGFVSRWRIKN